ncbi:Gfo/Idh/MocA family oxidoreductase [Solirhodobacter olei]|uniref:Gfo/Idh/MocA family oxidoreductase n=1 Tax=Solirhodobacter olei TaxID=2493082 RepID=UPI00240D1B35|nr:Gfo/Idh/MocA family oxidoreductase [Solirhodobacter olei]
MTIRVGIIGAGTMGRAHAIAIDREIKGAALAAVSEPEERNVAALRAAIGPVAIFADPEDLITSPDVDAVIIASPDHTHAGYTAACIRRGKPVLCEKPLADTSAACRQIASHAASPEAPPVLVGFMRRFDPAYRSLKMELARDEVGPLRLIRCVHRNRVAPAFFTGAMGISNAMVHEFDILRWLTGAEPVRVLVSAPPANAQERDPLLALVELSNGALADIEVSMNAGYGYDIRTQVLGREGMIEMAAPSFAQVGVNGRMVEVPCADFVERFADAYRVMLSCWVQGIGNGIPTAEGASAVDGLRAMQAAEAAIASLRSGGWSPVPPVGRDPW